MICRSKATHKMIPHKAPQFGFVTILVCLSLIAGYSASALAADTITGIARNRTRGGFAAGDEAMLLRLEPTRPGQTALGQGMHEEARTLTNSQGDFTFKVRFPEQPHVVRVLHQGVNYDRQASVGDAVSIDVFDTAAKVQGVTGSIEIMRIGTTGNHLHVSDMIEIKNNSSPPLTQAADRTFEVRLPAHARIVSVLAAGSGAGSDKIGEMISATPLTGEHGHYAVNFPLRPGSTKFAFNYDLPYNGHATFHTMSEYPLQQLAVMIPPTMKFTSSSPAFQILLTGNDRYRVEAVNQLRAGAGPDFEISGVGALPALRPQAPPPQPKPRLSELPSSTFSAASGSRAQTQRTDASRPLSASEFSGSSSRLQWWLVGVCAVIIGAGGFLLGRRQRAPAIARTSTKDVQNTEQPRQTSGPLLGALNEELVRLELERSHGTVSGEEYASAKQALEGTVKRASTRIGAAANF